MSLSVSGTLNSSLSANLSANDLQHFGSGETMAEMDDEGFKESPLNQSLKLLEKIRQGLPPKKHFHYYSPPVLIQPLFLSKTGFKTTFNYDNYR